jgi:hypothetical protein
MPKKSAKLLIGAMCAAGVLGCHGQRSTPTSAPLAQAPRSVFADSALHVRLCEPTKTSEDWRKTCVPKNQAVMVP